MHMQAFTYAYVIKSAVLGLSGTVASTVEGFLFLYCACALHTYVHIYINTEPAKSNTKFTSSSRKEKLSNVAMPN